MTFLVHPSRQQKLREEALHIRSSCGDAALAVKTITRTEPAPEYDHILSTAKAYDLQDAIETVKPAMMAGTGKKPLLIPFLNGMAHLTLLNSFFGSDNVLGGVVIIQSTLTKEGIIRHFNDSAFMFFGEQSGDGSLRAQTLQVCSTEPSALMSKPWMIFLPECG